MTQYHPSTKIQKMRERTQHGPTKKERFKQGRLHKGREPSDLGIYPQEKGAPNVDPIKLLEEIRIGNEISQTAHQIMTRKTKGHH